MNADERSNLRAWHDGAFDSAIDTPDSSARASRNLRRDRKEIDAIVSFLVSEQATARNRRITSISAGKGVKAPFDPIIQIYLNKGECQTFAGDMDITLYPGPVREYPNLLAQHNESPLLLIRNPRLIKGVDPSIPVVCAQPIYHIALCADLRGVRRVDISYQFLDSCVPIAFDTKGMPEQGREYAQHLGLAYAIGSKLLFRSSSEYVAKISSLVPLSERHPYDPSRLGDSIAALQSKRPK